MQRIIAPSPSPAPSLPPLAAGAWQLAAVNRLDLNVLPDFRWPRFLGQADAFVQQVGVGGLPWSVFGAAGWDGVDLVPVLPPGQIHRAASAELLLCLGCLAKL